MKVISTVHGPGVTVADLPGVLIAALEESGEVDNELAALALDRWLFARRAVNCIPFGEPGRRLAKKVARVVRAERVDGVMIR